MGRTKNKNQYNIDKNNADLDHLSDSVCLDYGEVTNSLKPINDVELGSVTPSNTRLSASTILSKSQKILFISIIGIILILFVFFDFYNIFMTFFYLIIIFKFGVITIYSIKKYNEK